MLTRSLLFLFLTLPLGACSTEGGFKLPGVYRIDIQQGNIVEQDMLNKLKPGMDETQVRFIMGTPVLVDPFHTDRWEYVFIFSEGGRQREQRHITVHFKDHKLAWVDGDVVIAQGPPSDELKPQKAPIEVPLTRERPGFFSRMFNALPFVGEKEAKPAKPADAEQPPAAPATEAAAPPVAQPGTPSADSAGEPPAGAASPPTESASQTEPQGEPAEPGAESGATESPPAATGNDEAGESDTGGDAAEPEPDERTTEPASPSDQGDWPVDKMPGGNDSGWPAETPPTPGGDGTQPGGDEGAPPQ